MKIDKGLLIFTLLLIVLAAVLVITSFTYKPAVRRIPLLIGIPTLLMAIFVLIGETFYSQLLRRLDVSATDFTGGIPEEEELPEKPSETKAGVGLLSMYVGLVGYFILAFLAGFLIANGVYLLVFLKVGAKVGWLKAIVISAIVWGFTYGVFDFFMKVDLFRGILFGEIVPSI